MHAGQEHAALQVAVVSRRVSFKQLEVSSSGSVATWPKHTFCQASAFSGFCELVAEDVGCAWFHGPNIWLEVPKASGFVLSGRWAEGGDGGRGCRWPFGLGRLLLLHASHCAVLPS